MKIDNFIESELQYFREKCNFTEDELQYFNLKAEGKSNVCISLNMHISERTVVNLGKKVRKKIIKVL